MTTVRSLPSRNALAEAYLAVARRRLLNLGDELWQHAREELLEGLRLGENVDQLAARLTKAAGLTEPRAIVIGRTEVLAAANAGALTQARALGLPATKQWRAVRGDGRTRPTHRHADEQKVDLDEHFTVGGFPADRPHDPSLPPHERELCRCTLNLDFDLSGLEGEPEFGEPPWADKITDAQDRTFLERVFSKGLRWVARWLGRLGGPTTAGGNVATENGGDAAMTETLAEPMVDMSSPVPEHFRSRMIVEGVSTGLRTFAEGALTWREPPFALRWQEREPETGGHALAVHVGNVARAERQGNELWGYGPLDLDSEDGLEFARKLAKGFARWVSIGLDESMKDSDVELVFPDLEDRPEDDNGDPMPDELAPMFLEPEQMIFHVGRIAELTAVTVPAMAEAFIEPTPALIEELERRGVLLPGELAAAASFADGGKWDGPAAMSRCANSDDPAACYNAICAGKKAGDPATQDAHALPHHETAGGPPHPGGVRSALQMLPKTKGLTNAEAARSHLEAHLNAINASASLVAAAHTITVQDIPPAEWFQEPTEEPVIGGLTVTDEGRIFGYLAPYFVFHRAYARNGQEVLAPRGTVDYAKWQNKTAFVTASDGQVERIDAGNVTMECNHGPTHSARVAREHYENSCAIVAKARVGENEHGTWIAGALLPDVTGEQVNRMLACELSGHWDPHETKAGWSELTAALFVPVGGFPKAQKASVRVRDGQLVASAVPVRHATCDCSLVAAGRVVAAEGTPHADPDRPSLESVKARIAASIGRDLGSRRRELAERVHAGRS